LLCVTAEALGANIDRKSAFSVKWGQFDPKSQAEGVDTPNILLAKNQDESSFMWYKNFGTSFFCFVTMHAFDRQTDRQTDKPLHYRSLHCMQSRSKTRTSDIPETTLHGGSILAK